MNQSSIFGWSTVEAFRHMFGLLAILYVIDYEVRGKSRTLKFIDHDLKNISKTQKCNRGNKPNTSSTTVKHTNHSSYTTPQIIELLLPI